MRLSWLGILAATLVGMLPLLPRLDLFYGAIATKYFFVLFVINIVIISAAVTWIARGYLYSLERRPFLYALCAFLIVQFLAGCFGVYFEHSLWGDVLRSTGVFFLVHIALMAYLLAEFLNKDDWSLVRTVGVLSAGAFSLLSLIGTAGLGYQGSFLWFNLGELGVSFGNDTFAGMYLVLAFLFGSIELGKSKGIRKNILNATLLLIALSPILFGIKGVLSQGFSLDSLSALLGSARASSIALWTALGLVGVWFGINRFLSGSKRVVVIKVGLVVLFASLAVAALALLIPHSVVQNTFLDQTTGARVIVWNSIGESIKEKPLLGWGPENFDQAFEANFDPALYIKAGTTEVWFDKAHNIILDTLGTIGVIGLLSLLALVGTYFVVLMYAYRNKRISEFEAVILGLIPVAHFIQLQTAFDVVPTYTFLGIVGGYVLSLEKQPDSKVRINERGTWAVICFGGAAIVSSTFLFFQEYPRQWALVESLDSHYATTRKDAIREGISKRSDYEGLHRSAILFTESVFSALSSDGKHEAVKSRAREYLALYIQGYERYLERQPHHYRARMNYAYLLLLDAQWGGARVDEARVIVQESRDMSSRNPLTDVLLTMAYVYEGDIPMAQETMHKAQMEYPGVSLVSDASEWLKKQEVLYPERSFLRIGNI